VDDELIKVVRIKHTKSARTKYQTDSFSDDFTKEVISAVRFAALAKRPRTVSIVPSRVWDPLIHMSYPASFQKVCKTILLCSSAARIQPLEQPAQRLNAASKLPKNLWMEILSYTHHSWFEQSTTSVEMLQQRLQHEQAGATKAAAAVRQAEQRIRVLERERDGYRLLALRWHSRFQELAAAAAGAAAAQQLQGGDSVAIASTTFTRLMDAMLNEPPTLDDDDDDDDSSNPDDAGNVAQGAMESSDEEEEEEDEESNNGNDNSYHAGGDDGGDDSSVFMQDADGEEADNSNNFDDDDFSINMELSVSSEPAVGTGTVRTTRTVSITSEQSP
jgi:hypothetical protein